MSHTLLKSLQCKGTTIFIANGVAAGQKAPHVLVHVFDYKIENMQIMQKTRIMVLQLKIILQMILIL